MIHSRTRPSKIPDRVLQCVAFSPDSRLAIAGAGDTIVLADIATEKVSRYPRQPIQEYNFLAFSPDGNILAAGSGLVAAGDEAVSLWDTRSGQETSVITQRDVPGNFYPLTCTPDSAALVVGGDHTIHVGDVTLGGIVTTLATPSSAWSAVFRPNRLTLATPDSSDMTIKLWSHTPD